VAVHHFAVAPRQHGDFESIFPDAAAHAINRGVVLAGTGVENQPVNVPDFYS
jgi:hypothetical protein